MKDNAKIILASSSPRRCELLKKFIKTFDVIPTDIDESIDETAIKNIEDCCNQVGTIAYKKASTLPNIIKKNSIIIGADTVVYLNGKIFGKPINRVSAEVALTTLSGKIHQVVTAVSVLKNGNEILNFSEVTDVEFIKFNKKLIDWYLTHEEYKDKAGGYAIQGLGSIFIENISGDYDNVVGLPIAKIIRKLSEISVDILGVY